MNEEIEDCSSVESNNLVVQDSSDPSSCGIATEKVVSEIDLSHLVTKVFTTKILKGAVDGGTAISAVEEN